MAITKIPYNNHDEWLAIRRKYIGGSDAGTVVGLNSYSSPFSLWAEKTGMVEPFSGNTITEVGSFLEEFVAQQFCKMTGKKVRKSNYTYVNDKYPWACANVDRIVVGEDAILEIKTTGNYEYMKHIRNGEPVPTWWCQLTQYMTVLEKPKAYLAVLLDCREVRILEFDFNDQESAALMDAEKEFWAHVESNTPPAADGSEATTETLKALYRDEGGRTDLTPVAAHLTAYKSLKAQLDELQRMLDEQKNAICSYMGTDSYGSYGAFTVSWKEQTRKTFDAKRFAADHPEAKLDKYYNSSPGRVFRFKEES